MADIDTNSNSTFGEIKLNDQFRSLAEKFSQLRPNLFKKEGSSNGGFLTLDTDNLYTNDCIYNKPTCYDINSHKPHFNEPTVHYDEKKFVETAKQNWEEIQTSVFELPPSVLYQINLLWKNKQALIFKYPQTYVKKDHVSLSTSGPTDTSIHFQKIKVLQESEAKCTINVPLTKEYWYYKNRRIVLPPITLSEEKQHIAVVSQDEVINNFVKEKDVSVVISSSGLKTILDNYADKSSEWTLPFCIKSVMNTDGSRKSVLYIDKALPRTHMSKMEQKNWHAKKVAYEFLCNTQGQGDMDSDDLFRDNISISKSECDDSSSDEESEHRTENDGRKTSINCKNLYSYALWKLSDLSSKNLILKNRKKDFTLLIRSKKPVYKAHDKEKTYCISAKLEYQPEFGGEHMSCSELTREWVSLILNPNSYLIRVRADATDLTYINHEIGNLDWIEKNMMVVHNIRLSRQLYLLQDMLTHLTQLPVGEYILQRTHATRAFATIYKASDSAGDLHLNNYFNELKVREEVVPWIMTDFALMSKKFRLTTTWKIPAQCKKVMKKKQKKKKKRKSKGITKDKT